MTEWKNHLTSSDPMTVRYLRSKELDDSHRLYYQMRLSSMKSLIDRLGLDCELSGHGGCVNCIEWNREGTLLASGSDDFRVMLWDPFQRKRLVDIDTGHQGNIFSVKFMPQSMDGLVASGAGDGRVKIHCVERTSSLMSPAAAQPLSFNCHCHASRVKRLAVAPDVPYLLWSGSEDGTIMQFDLRAPHNCDEGPSNILVNLLCHAGNQAEVKSIAINPLRTEQLAVGVNDPYVRLYDRRMIKVSSVQFNAERPPNNWGRQNILAATSRSEEARSAIPLVGCVQYFAPAHLPRKLDDYRRRFRSLSSTYVTFDPSGRYLLANLGGEQIYLYDCNEPNLPILMPPSVSVAKDEGSPSPSPLPAGAEQLKLQANAAFQQKQYTTAIGLYSRALLKAPKAAVLYSNRAAAYMKRNWDGDVYAALKDCNSALKLDGGGQFKAFHRLVRCFIDVGLPSAANQTLNMFKETFPAHAFGSTVRAMEHEIEKKLAAQQLLQQQRAAKKTNSGEDERTEQEEGEEEEEDSHRMPDSSWPGCSAQENQWRAQYWDYVGRYAGHCNTTTDIKEANFFGEDGQYIMAGSDDGCFFIWDRATGVVERVLRGDESIVNCLQPHPFTCLLASSGIDSVVRLWAPLPHEITGQDRVGSVVPDAESASAANQRRMNADPFEMFLMNMGATMDEGLPDIRPGRRARHPSPGGEDEDEDGRDENEHHAAPVQCRPS